MISVLCEDNLLRTATKSILYSFYIMLQWEYKLEYCVTSVFILLFR